MMDIILYGCIAFHAVCCGVMAYVVLTSRIPDLILVDKPTSMLMDDNY